MRVSFSACSSPVVVRMSEIGPSRTIRSTRRPVGRVWVFNRGLVDNPAFADETADQHGKRAVLVRLQLVRFIDEKVWCERGDGRHQTRDSALLLVRWFTKSGPISSSVFVVVNDLPLLLAPFAKTFNG